MISIILTIIAHIYLCMFHVPHNLGALIKETSFGEIAEEMER